MSPYLSGVEPHFCNHCAQIEIRRQEDENDKNNGYYVARRNRDRSPLGTYRYSHIEFSSSEVQRACNDDCPLFINRRKFLQKLPYFKSPSPDTIDGTISLRALVPNGGHEKLELLDFTWLESGEELPGSESKFLLPLEGE